MKSSSKVDQDDRVVFACDIKFPKSRTTPNIKRGLLKFFISLVKQSLMMVSSKKFYQDSISDKVLESMMNKAIDLEILKLKKKWSVEARPIHVDQPDGSLLKIFK